MVTTSLVAIDEESGLIWYLTARVGHNVLLFGNLSLLSSYHTALRDARLDSGRDQDTGAVVDESRTGHWLGAIGYLSFLDQVGTAIRRRGARVAFRRRPKAKPKEEQAILLCLRNFAPELTPRTRQAIYALRCSLAHDYSLFNEGRGATSELQFRFVLHADPGSPLIEHARRRWDGDFIRRPQAASATVVNLRALGEMAENCHRNIQRLAQNGEIRSRVPASHLIIRYGYSISEW